MRLARRVYFIAGLYGLAVLTPLYFCEARIGRHYPPAITHPEFFYGFIGLALLFQLIFFLIAQDPVRYRPLMILCMGEKLVYTVPVVLLFYQGRVPAITRNGSLVDPLFGLLFLLAFVKTPSE